MRLKIETDCLYASKLDGLSPLRKLDMGYGYIENSEGNRIVSAGQVSSDDEITAILKMEASDQGYRGRESMAKTLEQSFERLEEIIAQMEKSDTTLDASFKMYQEGMKLVESCNNQLDKIEKQIIVLNDDGENDDE
ncbi:MAG: exodeoxyribonuclease VII small subunit [Lachnospira eligens]